MSDKKTRLSSRRSRRRRAQGSKATAKISEALSLARRINARAPPRKATRRVGVDIISDRKAQGTSYVQTAIAGLGSSLTHQFSYKHFERDGVKGINCVGISPIQYAGYTILSTIYAFQSLSGGILSSVIPVNPLFLFPSLSNELQTMVGFTKFRFTKLKLVYVTHVNTGVVGNLMFGYYPDGALLSSDVNPTMQLAQPGTITTAVWSTNVGTDVSQFLDKQTWFYIDTDLTSDSGLRLSDQGDLTAIWGILPTAAQAYGLFYIDYEIDLIEPRTGQNIAGLSSSPQNLEIHRAFCKYSKEERKRAFQAFAEKFLLEKKSSAMDNSPDRKNPVEGGDEPVFKSQTFPDGTSATWQVQPLVVDDGIIPVSSNSARPSRSSSKK